MSDPGIRALATARCENCGAAVSASYCGECGQRAAPAELSLWHFAREAADDITNADSRVWRTLVPLLFRPGYLTREYLDGRRARYLPPFRLYLVVSLMCFVLASMLGPEVAPVGADRGPVTVKPGACDDSLYDGPWRQQILPMLQDGCRGAIADGGRELTRQFVANLPSALFVSLPLLALFMKTMYWRPRRYYVEHLLFFVHNHSFLFAAVGLLMVLRHFLGGRTSALLTLATVAYGAWYLYRAMMNVYGQRRWLTCTKFVALAAAYLVGGVFMMVLTLFYSFVALSIEGGLVMQSRAIEGIVPGAQDEGADDEDEHHAHEPGAALEGQPRAEQAARHVGHCHRQGKMPPHVATGCEQGKRGDVGRRIEKFSPG